MENFDLVNQIKILNKIHFLSPKNFQFKKYIKKYINEIDWNEQSITIKIGFLKLLSNCQNKYFKAEKFNEKFFEIEKKIENLPQIILVLFWANKANQYN